MGLGEKSLFWDKPDAVLMPEELQYYQYSGQDLASYYECMYTTGITPQMVVSRSDDNQSSYIGSSLSTTSGDGLQVVISPGTAMIKGRPYLLSLPLKFNIADGAITDILLQSNARQEKPEIKLIARKRPADASVIENIKRESLIYEIAIASIDVPIASVQITPIMVTDQRLNMSIHMADSKPISGICQSIPKVNTLGIWEDYSKVDAYIKSVWRTFIDGSTHEWAAFLSSKKNEFTTWFKTLQDILSGDVAGKLAAEILKVKSETKTALEGKSDKTAITAFNATATYSDGSYNLDILNKPNKLPENYQVTFTAPTNYIAGDKIKINGVEHLVNLYEKGFNNPNTHSMPSSLAGYVGDGYFRFANSFVGTSWRELKTTALAMGKLKPNTAHTVFLEIDKSSTVPSEGFIYVNNVATDAYSTNQRALASDTSKRFKNLIKTKSVIPTEARLIRVGTNGDIKNPYVFLCRIMLVEGDYTNKELPADYWENTYGVYDILNYGNDALGNSAFTAGQTVTLTVGVSGAYFNGGLDKSAPLVMGGAQSLAVKQVRNVTISNTDPSGGVNGDMWFKYS